MVTSESCDQLNTEKYQCQGILLTDWLSGVRFQFNQFYMTNKVAMATAQMLQ